uniref:Uncharacterized protein n=1 Tax=Phanerochaete carnosa TaxID=231932 RepID=A0A895KT85_9APHY|nr:hypothetical protein K8K84_mgp066 [Phanerochaete carnosa]QRZ60386.1 hypothetical protein [Phanerochaete carnosa]
MVLILFLSLPLKKKSNRIAKPKWLCLITSNKSGIQSPKIAVTLLLFLFFAEIDSMIVAKSNPFLLKPPCLIISLIAFKAVSVGRIPTFLIEFIELWKKFVIIVVAIGCTCIWDTNFLTMNVEIHWTGEKNINLLKNMFYCILFLSLPLKKKSNRIANPKWLLLITPNKSGKQFPNIEVTVVLFLFSAVIAAIIAAKPKPSLATLPWRIIKRIVRKAVIVGRNPTDFIEFIELWKKFVIIVVAIGCICIPATIFLTNHFDIIWTGENNINLVKNILKYILIYILMSRKRNINTQIIKHNSH